MADIDNDQENNEEEDTGNDAGFLKDAFDTDSQLDELTFDDDDFNELMPEDPAPVDDLLSSPLANSNCRLQSQPPRHRPNQFSTRSTNR